MFNKLNHKPFLLLLLFCCAGLQLNAAKRYWISASTSGWNSMSNWSSASGGSSGASVPGSNDTCYFDGSGLGRCNIDANVNVKRFEIVSTYNDTITQNGFTITVGSGGMKLAGTAVFIGSSSAITVNATVENTACKFTSTSGTFEIKEGHFTLSGTGSFLHNNGLVRFFHGTGASTDTCKITISTSSSDNYFYDLEMNSASTWNRYYKFPSGTMRVNHLLTMSGTGSKFIGPGTVELLGDYTHTGGIVNGGSLSAGTLKFMGTGNQSLTGSGTGALSNVVNIDINKSSGTLYLVGTVSTAFELKRSSGTIDAGASRFYIGAVASGTKVTGNFTRSNSLNKLYFVGSSSGSLTIDDTLQVKDSIVFSRITPVNKGANAGILCAKGHINIAGNFPVTGTMTLLINGIGKQVYKSGVIYDFNRTQGSPNIKIQKDLSDTLKMEGFHPIQTTFTYVSGVINSDLAHIKFSAGNQPVITGSVSLKNVEFCYSSTISTHAITITSGTQLSVGDSLVVSGTGGTSNTLNTGIVNVKGNMYISCTSTGNAGTATIKFNGTGNQHIYGFTGSGTQGRLPNVEIDKTSGTLYLHNNICMGTSGTANTFTHTQGTIDYGTSTLIFANNCNITSSVTGNRLELYNVQFTTGTIGIQGSTTLVVNGDLSASASSTALTINGNVLESKGNITINNTNSSISSAGTVSMLINGSGNQVFTGSGVSATGFLPKITINKTAGTLFLASIISAGNDWTYTAGDVDASTYTSKVYFGGTHNIDAQGTSSVMNFYDVTIGGTSTLTGDLNIKNNLVINSGATLIQGSYALNFGGYNNIGTHSGTGAVSFVGSGYNTFAKSGGGTTSFGAVILNRSGGSLTLASPVNITGSLTLVKGVIKTTASNLLKFADKATSGEGNDSAYVHGPVQKTGNAAFLFPLGDTAVSGSGKYHPLKISAPSSTGDVFTAQYLASGQTLGTAVDTTTIDSLNSCQRWTVSRDVGVSQVRVSVYWNKDCGLSADANDMRFVQWNGTLWAKIGDEVTGNSIISKNNLDAFGSFTLAQGFCSVAQKVNPVKISGATVQKTNSGTSDGSVTLSVSGGSAPYTYNWSSGPTTASISGLSAGLYTVTVSDVHGCAAKKYFFIGSKGATNTYTLTPDALAGTDATVLIGQDGITGSSSNYGTYANTDAGYIQDGAKYYTSRSFLRYDFSSLPLNTIVNSASLQLYGTGANLSASDNTCLLKRVGSNWEENTLTWNNQPYTYDSDSIHIDSTKSASRNYTVDVLAHVKKMLANPYGNNGWMLRLRTESSNPPRLSFGSSDNPTIALRPGIVISFTIPDDCDLNRNWVQTTTYGEEGEITSQSRSFMDNLGRSTQDQARILSSGLIMASQTMYDAFGRPVGSTLPAPTYTNSLCFKTNFILDDSSHAYTWNDFDKPATGSNLIGELNNPMGVDNSTQGTLGWYYSNNNTEEPFVAASSFPYSRVQYSNDPTGSVWKSSGVDTMFRMGSGHETKTFSMPSAGELDYVFGYHGTYNLGEDFSPLANYKSENLLLYKTISVNADGKEAVSYSNSSGQLIASCVSGAAEICTPQDVVQAIRYVDRGYTTIHLPKAKNGSLSLPKLCVVCEGNTPYSAGGNSGFTYLTGDAAGDIRILYKIQDAETNEFLIENTHYTINRSTRAVTFLGAYAGKSLVLNIAYDVIPVAKTSAFLATPPELAAAYTLDYSQWNLNYYDLKGRLVSSVAPNDINCSDYFQGGDTYVEITSGAFKYTDRNSIIPSDHASPGTDQSLVLSVFSTYQSPLITGRYAAPDSNNFSFSRPLSKASFGYLADTTTAIDSTFFKALSSEWDTVNFNKAIVPLLYEPNMIVLDSLGNPSDTLVDSLSTRFSSVDPYIEIAAEVALSLQANAVAPFVDQPQEQTLRFRLMYSDEETGVVLSPVDNNMVSYQLQPSDLSSIYAAGINIKNKRVYFHDYPGIDPSIGYDITQPAPPGGFLGGGSGDGLPGPSGISRPLWESCVYMHAVYLKINFEAVLNSYHFDVTQTPTTKLKYDTYNRVVQTISQDEGQSDVIYDGEGKVRFTQNALQRTAGNGGRFNYVNYDKRGRVVESGEYDPNIPNGTATKLYFQTQAQFDAGTNVPPSGSGSVVWIRDFTTDAIDGPRKLNKSGVIYDCPPGDIPTVTGASPAAYAQRNTHGRISKAYNDNGATWYSYDERGGLSWTVQDITGLGKKTYNYVTSLFGRLEQTQYQKENNSERLFHKYQYDADARLTASYASTDGGFSWDPLTKNEYYQHGPLKRMVLGNKLQGLDYVYTVGGALKSINDPYLSSADPGGDYSGSVVNPDVFGYSIDYYPGDYKREGTGIQTYDGSNFGGSNNSYAGIIKSVRWKTVVPSGATNNYGTSTLMQEYNYDFNYQLTDALFTPVSHNSGSVPSNTVQPGTYHNPGHGQFSYAYQTTGITYDLNGNIQTLQRNPYVGLDAGVSPSDNLTYHYSATQKNRLLYVSDAAGTSTGTETDFPNQSSANYEYDAIGQLIGDVKDNLKYEYYADGLIKAIRYRSTNVTKAFFEYNHLGLRQRKITCDAGGEAYQYTWYVYDPGGALVSTYTTNIGAGTTTQEDLPLYAGGRVGMYNKSTGRYSFELTDHLGNVRSVIAKASGSNAVEVLSYSDYYPHGGVLPGRNFVSSPVYKMGYGGMEKDGETNFTNFELRQYDPRLGRWFNPDPMGQYYSPYLSMGNNPVSFIDPTGGAANEFNQDEYEANLSFDFGGAGWFEGQFGQNYQHGGASYGSVTASGQFYSDYEQINDASAIQEKKNKKKAEEEAKKKPDPNSQIPGREPDPIIEGVLLPTFDYDENGRWLYDVHALVQSVFDNMQYYSSFAKDGVLYLNGIGKADLGDYMGVRVMATGVPVQDVYDMQKILRDREIWAQYGKNFNDLADASETAVIIGACVVGGAAGILVATEVGLVAIVVESKVIQKIVRIGSKFKTTGFEKMGFKDLQALTKTHSKELNAFFKSGGKGNIAKEALQSYKELATRMVNGTGGAYQKVTAEAAKLHMERIEMINNALKNM